MWIGTRVSKDSNFTRACDHIDVDITKNEFFCRRDKDITRSRDNVYFGDTPSTIRHRTNSARTANFKRLCDATQVHCRKQKGIELIMRGWRADNNLFNASHNGRNRIHQKTAWIRRFTTWNVKPCTVDGCHFLS